MPNTVTNLSKIILIALLFFALGLFLSTWSSKHPSVNQWGQILISEVQRPFQLIIKGLSTNISKFWERYFILLDAQKENESIKARLKALEAENSKLREWEAEIERLRKLLNVGLNNKWQGLAADVISYDPSNWVRSITISAGSIDGIMPGMAVVEGNAAIGQVIATSPHTAKILLITDRTSGIDVIAQSNRSRGVLEGNGDGKAKMRYVPQDEEIRIGERIVTSGLDGVFPKGVFVGIVTQVEKDHVGIFYDITVKPAFNLAKLETVLVLTENNFLSETKKLKMGK